MATDVTGAEGLLERHQEYRTEIDARAGTFVAFEQFGTQLLVARHYASKDVEDKIRRVADARESLEKLVLLFCFLVLTLEARGSHYPADFILARGCPCPRSHTKDRHIFPRSQRHFQKVEV
jgi:hypothetical protein